MNIISRRTLLIGGTLDILDNPCKAITEKAKGTVISIDYALAPETPYPGGLNDCRKVVKHIQENSTYYAINTKKIAICGESAGGNLAAIIANENPNIKFQALLYPVVTLAN